MTRHERRTCPHCGTPGAVPIVFGLPRREVLPHAREGRLALGGCVVPPERPFFDCLGCGRAFGFDDEDRAASRALLDEMLAKEARDDGGDD